MPPEHVDDGFLDCAKSQGRKARLAEIFVIVVRFISLLLFE